MGASIIEKHFTLDRNGGGADDSFSLEPDDLVSLVYGVKTAWSALGKVTYERQASEKGNVKFRRSLYFVKNMKSGDVITEACVRSVRPGFGLAPKFFNILLGKKVLRDVVANTPVSYEVIEGLSH
jgi:N-acetylneuraminate synthase